jgi:hypothetical protein
MGNPSQMASVMESREDRRSENVFVRADIAPASNAAPDAEEPVGGTRRNRASLRSRNAIHCLRACRSKVAKVTSMSPPANQCGVLQVPCEWAPRPPAVKQQREPGSASGRAEARLGRRGHGWRPPRAVECRKSATLEALPSSRRRPGKNGEAMDGSPFV